MKSISTSTFNFPDIVRNDFLYVDKTADIWRLVKDGKGEYFLSRPRRFGKSLLVSTLKALFQGRRDLFKGLAIDKTAYDWKTYPVIHLDFGNAGVESLEELNRHLATILEDAAEQNSVQLRGKDNPIKFKNLILDLAKANGQVVILVDEYDKPILSNVVSKAAPSILKLLKRFYGVIKTCEGHVRFALVTGVSKFSHVSLFSDLNNLTDLTLRPDYASLLGFTEAEIRRCFADRIPLAAKANGLDDEALMRQLLQWYDGYRFSDAPTHVCNPISISKFFSEGYRFTNYWDSTGTPTFLLDLMREKSYDHEAALQRWYGESIFASYELGRLDITGLLWQTGYLTIKETRQDAYGPLYRLDFPDREVQATFNSRLVKFYAGGEERGDEALAQMRAFAEAIRNDDLDGFLTLFQSFLACISYRLHLPDEKYYQTIFFVVFKFLGAAIEAESCTNEGRIDAYVRTAKAVYVFEFKLNKGPRKAVRQILDRHYYEKFQACGLPIRLIGVNFDATKGRLDSWKETTLAEELKPQVKTARRAAPKR